MAHTDNTPRAQGGAAAVFEFILDNSLLLISGAVAALVWANLDLEHYTEFTHGLHFVVNDIAMVFFFALATKEVYEATLPGGPLSSPREAAVPVLAACGGMIAPASLYLISINLLGTPELHPGWAIPCATDIAFSYLVARVIFPRGHPAIPFLLLLAIADDALGLIVLAIFYPSGDVSILLLFGLLLPAIGLGYALRRSGVESPWAYVLGPGLLSWLGLYYGGLHPALALVPIVPLMPHHHVDLKLFRSSQTARLATMHQFEQWWRIPVQFILLGFGLVNAGVPFSAVGPISWIVFGSLVAGKPIGVVGTTLIAERVGFRRAAGLDYPSLFTLGIAAGIGFTVALFFATAAFPPGLVLDEAKMGALFSFFASAIAIAAGLLLGIKRRAAEAATRGLDA
jgi:NhaA family Na+:H+ antiporter